MPELDVRPISPEAFAPYGQLIQATSEGARPINAGSSLRTDLAQQLQLTGSQGQPTLAVFRASGRSLTGPWTVMERHQLGSQSFIGMDGVRSVVLVALGEHKPDPDTLAAFLVQGAVGYTLAPGTWHHPLIALEDGDFVVIERGADTVDCEVVSLDAPVFLRHDSMQS